MCEECRHHPCISACPNYEPPVAYKCDCCGGNIYAGDTVYIINDNHYCEYCCYQAEAEVEEYDDSDYKYEMWRDQQLMDEWEKNDDR